MRTVNGPEELIRIIDNDAFIPADKTIQSCRPCTKFKKHEDALAYFEQFNFPMYIEYEEPWDSHSCGDWYEKVVTNPKIPSSYTIWDNIQWKKKQISRLEAEIRDLERLYKKFYEKA